MKQELSQESLEQFPLSTTKPPRGWSAVLLTDIASEITPGFASGKHDSHGGGQPHLRPMNVDRSGQIALDVVKFVPPNEDRVLSAGDVLFNNTNSPELVGKTALVGVREHGFAYSNHMTRIRVDSGMSSSFVAHQLHFLWMTGYMRHRCTNHVNQASISSKTLAHTVPLLLPPPSEQVRIVEKLEELLSDLDAGVAELKAAQRKLAQYRQSLLKAAVKGALTTDWRATRARSGEPQETGTDLLQRILTERQARWEAKQLATYADQGKAPPKGWQAKYPEPSAPDTTDLFQLPEGWAWASLDALIEEGPQNGLYLPANRYGQGTPILRIDDYQIGWHRERDALNRVQADAPSCRTYALTSGDIVINRVNSMTHLGKCLEIADTLDGVLFESNMMRLRLHEGVSARFVSSYLGSMVGRAQLTKDAKWAVNQASINQQDVRRTPVPLPSAEEQIAIVEQLEMFISDTAAKLVAVELSLKQAAAQRKNILKAAFAGQLVPQNPSDEPASALLERIRATRVARAATGRGKTGRKRKETS